MRFEWGWLAAAIVVAAPGAAIAESAAPVRGAVFEPWTHRPLAGWTVVIGARSTKTDRNGRFVIAEAPPAYDVLVTDPDRACVSVYVGVHRRDLWLEHHPCAHAPSLIHGAAIRGTLSGGGPFPIAIGNAMIQFASEQVQGSAYRWPGPRRTSADPPPDTPAYGPIVLRWEGLAAVKGELLALRRTPEATPPKPPAPEPPAGGQCTPLPPRPASTWAFARRELSIASGQAVTADMALKDIPAFKVKLKIAGSLGAQMQRWDCFYQQEWPKVRRILVAGAERAGRRDPLSYELSVPDLRGTGASLCVEAGVGWSRSIRCGIAPGDTVTLTGAASPTFASPASGAVLRPSTTFAWSAGERGVSALTCEVWSPKPDYPNVTLYTAARSTTFPDLSAVGVRFPALRRAFPEGNAAYKCRVGLLQPYATMDEATGPDGVAAASPKDHRQSFSLEIGLQAPP